MSIQVDGIEKVLKAIGEPLSDDKISQLLDMAGLYVERSARRRAPKDTGALRRSISHRVEGNTCFVFSPLEYAPYVEYGTGLFAENGGRQDVPWLYKDDEGKGHITSGQHPYPFLRPALEARRCDIIRLFKEAMRG